MYNDFVYVYKMAAGNAKGLIQLRTRQWYVHVYTTVYLFSMAFQTDLQQSNKDLPVYQNVSRTISQDAIDELF